MKKLAPCCLTVLILFTAACYPQTPVGTFVYEYTDPPPDMTIVPRLSIDSSGGTPVITDRLMGGQACAWMLNKACEERCFPVEPLYPACNGDGEILYYTKQLLSTKFVWGRVETLQDPACQGRSTNQLVELSFIAKGERQGPVFVCGHRTQSLEPSLYDRNWYRAQVAELLPATVQDLPSAPK